MLSQIPVIGPVLFDHSLIVYLMYVTVAALQILVFRSRWGLRMRSVGEHPKAADTVGIKVNATRVRSTILGSALAGLGGAALVSAGLAFTKELDVRQGLHRARRDDPRPVEPEGCARGLAASSAWPTRCAAC